MVCFIGWDKAAKLVYTRQQNLIREKPSVLKIQLVVSQSLQNFLQILVFLLLSSTLITCACGCMRERETDIQLESPRETIFRGTRKL